MRVGTYAKPTLLLAAMLLCMFAGITPVHAENPQSFVIGTIVVFKGTTQVSAVSSVTTACGGTDCGVSVTVSKRDFGRVERWCGTTAPMVTVPAGNNGAVMDCPGPSAWRVNRPGFSGDSFRPYGATGSNSRR